MFRSINLIKYLIVLTLALCFIQILTAKKFNPSPILKSALVPGWGQVSIDRPYGYAMLASEFFCWSAYYYSHNEQTLKARESYEYALEFAHINPGSYNSSYYNNLRKFNSSGFEAGGYNDFIRQEAIYRYPDDPVQQQAYIDENGIPDEMAWNWDNIQRREDYSIIRKEILELKDQAQIISGVLIANHLISSIDILRLKKHWKHVKPSFSYYQRTPVLNLNIEF